MSPNWMMELDMEGCREEHSTQQEQWVQRPWGQSQVPLEHQRGQCSCSRG